MTNEIIKKTFKVSRGYTYTYYTASAQPGKPTLLLFHGWPDNAKLFFGLITDFLIPEGYGAIALDMLGYDSTDKPEDYKEYNFISLTQDAADILDNEGIETVISAGHDWGSACSQRFYNLYPERVRGVIMINVAYLPPRGRFDLKVLKELQAKLYGFSLLEYWDFFTAPDGAKILNEHLESVYCVIHGPPETWRGTFCTPNGFRNFVVAGHTQPTEAYATPEHMKAFIERMRRDRFDAPQCYYKAMVFGEQDAANDVAAAKDTLQIKVPTLFWAGTKDMVCPVEAIKPSVDGGLLPYLTVKTAQKGHWALIAHPRKFGEDVVGWLKENF
ncbi:hypothetical protein FOYG_00070 [Fusarium oxysporum NRRL 32931]|uniref:AB hydrolase-1 domain-containing protein n=1 Tax=Fusarium oxysporum NRRL 32931 TaxID=660029 RepID=W9J3K4_FUSOX|nr:hypothetical protein FOYG_00070 [Fusarium oxysporum NRRL 32931]